MSISSFAKILRGQFRPSGQTPEPAMRRTISASLIAATGVLFMSLLPAATASAQDYAFNTIAGGFDGEGLPATSTNVSFPVGIAFDANGDLYVADYARERIRRMSSDGTMQTVVGNGTPDFRGDGRRAEYASISGPLGLVLDAAGNLYFSDSNNNRVRRVSPDGIITTVAGNGTAVFSGDGGPAVGAGLRRPYGLAIDAVGNLYIADSLSNRVRMVTPAGLISTVAGNGASGFGGDGGVATAASLRQPGGLALDAGGNLYISDSGNHRIRKVLPNGIIITVAGNGSAYGTNGDGGPATAGRITSPYGVAVDTEGNLYIGDSYCYIRKVDTSGTISRFAGDGTCGYGGGEGVPAWSSIEVPEGLAISADGNLYFADSGNARVRKIAGGVIHTVAGAGKFAGDGGPALEAIFSTTAGISVDAIGNLYVADSDRNNRIRKISSDGSVATIAGNGSDWFDGDFGPAAHAGLTYPIASALDASGNLYITELLGERIRKVSPGGTITTIAGDGGSGSTGDGGLAESARVHAPSRLAIDGSGNIYFADTANNKIRRIGTNGIITTVAGNGVAGYSGDGGPAASARLFRPFGIAVDTAGNLLIADTNNYRIRKVDPAGVISTIAGNGVFGSTGDGGAAVNASIGRANGIAIGADGTVYIASGALRKLAPDGTISTVQALRYPAYDVAVDGSGAIYVATLGGRILKGQPLPPISRRSPQLIKSPK